MVIGEDKLNIRVLEKGIIAGNLYNKYETKNPIARLLMNGFNKSFKDLVDYSGAMDINEVGCGEGNLSIALAKQNKKVRGSDFSKKIILKAIENAKRHNVEIEFKAASIYDLVPERDSAELIVCCEVLEHLENPHKALAVLKQLAKPYLLISVPWNPYWKIMNIIRCKYVSRMGNTPGHIQHWSKESFLEFLKLHFKVIQVYTPIPWIMVLCKSNNTI